MKELSSWPDDLHSRGDKLLAQAKEMQEQPRVNWGTFNVCLVKIKALREEILEAEQAFKETLAIGNTQTETLALVACGFTVAWSI